MQTLRSRRHFRLSSLKYTTCLVVVIFTRDVRAFAHDNVVGLTGGRSEGFTITSALIASKLLLPAAIFFGPATLLLYNTGNVYTSGSSACGTIRFNIVKAS